MFNTPRKASTLIITRESEKKNSNFEVLMLLRHPGNKFVPSHFVFPGGALDNDDFNTEVEKYCEGMDSSRAAGILPEMTESENALAYWVAAVRETFEETGLLFAYNKDNSLVSIEDKDEVARFRGYREKVYTKQERFSSFIIKEDLALATDQIHYFSHWITPPFSSIRYDTRFFLAVAPEKQQAVPDNNEVIQHVWISPGEALQGPKKLKMVLPTRSTMETLSRYRSIDEALSILN